MGPTFSRPELLGPGGAKSGDGDEASNGGGKQGDGSSDGAKTSAQKPGTLSIYCKPACDQVIVGGQALGPSPVSGHSMAPGQHRVTLKRDGVKKTISVVIASGHLTAKSVPMK